MLPVPCLCSSYDRNSFSVLGLSCCLPCPLLVHAAMMTRPVQRWLASHLRCLHAPQGQTQTDGPPPEVTLLHQRHMLVLCLGNLSCLQ